MNLLQMAAVMGVMQHEVDLATDAALKKAANVLEKEAKSAIGTYRYGWEPLAASTLARKAADTPLLETGELQRSIENNVGHKEAWVGTDDRKATWLEFGTSKMPARPFMGGALNAKGEEVKEIVARHVHAAMLPK